MTGLATGRKAPLIQFWDVDDAPQYVAELLSDICQYEWIALVPAALAETEVPAFLVGSTGELSLAQEIRLPDGSLILAARQSSALPASSGSAAGQGAAGKRSDNPVR